MLLTLEPLQASEGDCLLLHWGTPTEPKLAIIDGGPGNTYDTSLIPRLDKIMRHRRLSTLPIDLVMVSHVDNDHIVGVKKLFQRLRDDLQLSLPSPFVVRFLWHNTFNDILGDGIDQYYRTLTASLAASVGGKPNPKVVTHLAKAIKQRYPNDPSPNAAAFDIALVLAGHGEGRQLRDSFDVLYNASTIGLLNAPFTKNGMSSLITLGKKPLTTHINGLAVTIVGPIDAEIQALQVEFDKFIKDKGVSATAMLAAYADKSIKNLSSIVCLVEMGGKRILLTGDARGDKILEGLRKAKLLKNEPLKVDILKVPHHGSDRNVEPEFFSKILADTYVFSGDGKHGNPERETLEWLTEARGKGAQYTIVLTYPVSDIDSKRKAEVQNRGKTWKKAAHSLEAFFTDRINNGFQFTLKAGGLSPINLGQPLPF